MKPLVKIIFYCLIGAVAFILWSKPGPLKQNVHTEKNNLPFSISGCDFVKTSTECLLYDSSEITLWIQALPSLKFQISFSGNKSKYSVEEKSKQNGFTYSYTVPPGSHHLKITNIKQKESWNITVIKRIQPDWLLNYQDAREKNNLILAARILNSQLSESDEFEQAYRLYYLGRVNLRNNDLKNAVINLDLSSKLFKAQGFDNKAIDNLLVTTYIYLFLKDDIHTAKELLNSIKYNSFDAKTKFYLDFYYGHLTNYLGELVQANYYFSNSLAIAQKHNLLREKVDAEHMLSRVLLSSGKINTAISMRENILKRLPDDWSGCRKLIYFNGLGWSQTQLKEATQAKIDPSAILIKALDLLEKHCPNRDIERVNILLNLSKNAYLDDSIEQSLSWLDQVTNSQISLPYRQKLEYTELRALLALKQSTVQTSLRLFNELLSAAEQVKYSDLTIKALVGIAQAYEVIGNQTQALYHYKRAEKLLFSQTLHIPLTSSQPFFLSKNSNFSSRYIELLYTMGEKQEALLVARKFRTYWFDNIREARQLALTQLAKSSEWAESVSNIKKLRKSIIAQQSLEWTLPQNQLAAARMQIKKEQQALEKQFDKMVRIASSTKFKHKIGQRRPTDDELLLFFYPVDTGWLGFAQTQDGIYIHKVNKNETSTLSPDSLAQQWISKFSSLLEKIDTLVVYPYGILNQVDFHKLSFKNKPLLSKKHVLFGVDVTSNNEKSIGQFAVSQAQQGGAINSEVTKNQQKKYSLIVANSRGDLKETEYEAKSIELSLDKTQWSSNLFMDSQTDIQSIKKSLEQASLFHYAGHVYPSNSNQSRFFLPLSNNSRLNVMDILLLKRVPRWVVLSACNSAASSQSNIESLGLAQAFVLSGSQDVIATSRQVKDKDAHLLMKQFYRRWSIDGNFKRSFRLAQLDMLKVMPESDWLAFRIVTS